MSPGSSGAFNVPRLILVSLLLLAFGLRIYHLDYQSLWRDETDAILFARQDLSGLLPLFVTPGHNGPLYYVILHGWVRLVGDSEFSVRFLSLLCGVLAVPVVYLLGRLWVGRAGSLVAALLCATSPYLIWYGQEGKMYALLFLLSALSTYVHVLALERNRLHLWSCYVALVAVSMYVHLLSVLVLPFHFTLFLVNWPRYRAAWRSWLTVFVVLGLPYLPLAQWQVPLLMGPFATGHQFYSLHEILAILLFVFSLNVAPYGNLFPLVVFVFLLLAGLLLRVRWGDGGLGAVDQGLGGRGRERIVLALYLLVPVLCLFGVSLGMPIFTDRYLITVVPAFLLLLSRGVVAVGQRSQVVAIACLSLVLVSNLSMTAWQGHAKIKPDFRGVAQYVKQEAGSDLLIFLIPQVRPVFDYYYDQQFSWADAPYTNWDLGAGQVAGHMEEVTEGYEEVWLIVSEAELWDSRGMAQEWLEGHGTLLGHRSFARVDAYLYALTDRTTGEAEDR